MMFHSQGTARHTCSLLAVTCGNSLQEKYNRDAFDDRLRFPFPELVSSGHLEVKILSNPSKNEICKVIDSYQPNLLYLQGEELENDEVGSLVLADVDFSSAEAIRDLFRTTLPTTVYLEIPNGDQLAEALHSKGIPYVIYWKNTFSRYTSCHFRNAFLSVVQSSSTHIWDAFQLGLSSFRIYCLRSSHDSDRLDEELEPHLLGEPSKINVEPPEVEVGENEDGSPPLLPTINIHNDDVTTRFLICGESSTVDESLLGSLEDGLNALLNIEIHGGKLHGKFSAPPPSLQAGTFSRGVVTMRCDLSTSSAAHISLLVSGSAQTCFDDQLLENHIKNEIIENALLVRSILDSDGNKVPLSEPRKSESIACGATVFEVSMKVPSWALQVLRQLAPDVSYRSLVALGIASVQGLPVASFEKEDAERLLFFCSRHEKEIVLDDLNFSSPPSWLKPPVPSRKRCQLSNGEIISLFDSSAYENILPTCKIKEEENQDGSATNGFKTSALPAQQRFRVAALRPIPRSHRHKIMPFSGITESNGQNGGQIKANMPMVPSTKQNTASATQRKTFSNFSQSKQLISLNPLPLKKHGCDRSSIHTCCEENFLKDVMEFLILRGHKRLIPQGGFAEFPEAILNGKRLDLYNLYKEVVTRGGFHVGNGINWKGQIFSKMRNYTMTNRMTGVGNTLKRHYETYLLEYELAHDDVDGECCLLCHSSAAGDWVNCGICGEWAHFGCDRRQGLGAFKDYAKTDGLEYICPHCSVANFKKKSQKIVNGYSQG